MAAHTLCLWDGDWNDALFTQLIVLFLATMWENVSDVVAGPESSKHLRFTGK